MTTPNGVLVSLIAGNGSVFDWRSLAGNLLVVTERHIGGTSGPSGIRDL